MNAVLLSGGSGKRLWPLSNEANSKQFLTLLRNEYGEKESMVQRVYRQLKEANPRANVLVSTNAEQVDAVHRQLGEKLDIAIEPARGNTYPAIVLAAAYLRYVKKLDDDEPIVVLPIDVCADIEYFKCLEQAEKLLINSNFNLVLMGVVPTYPSEKYGYIMSDMSFKEKPNVKDAAEFIKQGAMWNCGVFALRIGYILDNAKSFIEFNNYDDVLRQYDKLPFVSFDYQVSEHEKSIGMVTYDGKWKDLGTWNTLTEEMENVTIGADIIRGDGCEDTHILNMLDIPIVTLGVPNAVVVASHDGILVADKNKSSFMKPYVDKITRRVMYEQRKWGNYRVLDYRETKDSTQTIKRTFVKAGEFIGDNEHYDNISESWIILSGEGVATIGDEKCVASVGSVINLPVKVRHKLAATSDMELLEIQTEYTRRMK